MTELEKEKKEDLGESISKEVTKKEVELGRQIPRDEILKTAQLVYKEKLDTALKKQEIEFRNKFKELERQVNKLKAFKPSEIKLDFSKDWDKNIEYIQIEFYTLKVRTEFKKELISGYKFRKGQCEYCFFYEKLGYIKKLFDLYKFLGIPSHKYAVKVWNVDQLDRFLCESDDPNYTDKLTPEGMNWFYVKGLNIIKFPAIDLRVKFTQGFLNRFESKRTKINVKKPNNFYRQQGIGRNEDGEWNFGGLINGLIEFLKDFDEGKLNASVLKHKEKVLANDPELDKKHSLK